MESTTNLALPYIMPSQAQKHVTHNEALQILDALVQLSLKSRRGRGFFRRRPTKPSEGRPLNHGSARTPKNGWHGRSGSIPFSPMAAGTSPRHAAASLPGSRTRKS